MTQQGQAVKGVRLPPLPAFDRRADAEEEVLRSLSPEVHAESRRNSTGNLNGEFVPWRRRQLVESQQLFFDEVVIVVGQTTEVAKALL